MDKAEGGGDVETTDLPEYTYQHSTTGVIYKVIGVEARKASKVYLEEMMDNLGIIFPEGDWEVIGVKTYQGVW